MKRLLITSSIVVGILVMTTPAFASEVTGTVSTGVSTGIEGIVVTSPIATPGAGTYTNGQSVVLSAAGSSSIHYFLNTTGLDSALTCSSGSTYTSPVAINGSGLLRAIACYGSTASPVVDFSYVISTVTTPATPSGGGGGGGGGGIIGGTSNNNGSPLPGSHLVGDINLDGVVDILDFNALLVHWGQVGTGIAADLNNDGVVDILDFNMLIIHMNL